jgi:hypothetical protein
VWGGLSPKKLKIRLTQKLRGNTFLPVRLQKTAFSNPLFFEKRRGVGFLSFFVGQDFR